MKSIKNWHPRRYPAPYGPRLMPHDYYLFGSGHVELVPGPVIFLDEPYWDDEGNCAGVERVMLPVHIVDAATKAAPMVVPPKANSNSKPPFGVQKKKRKR